MAHVIPIDTLNYANRLKSVNVPDNQAEMQAILAKEQADKINEIIDNNLATKDDLKATKEDLYKHINTFGYLLCGLIIIGVSLLGFMIAHYGQHY